jgi:hypothetical protein
VWVEGLVVVFLCWVYDAVANLAPLRPAAANHHASSALHLEALLHADPEAALNHWLAGHHTLGLWLSNYYDNAHFVVTLGVIGWLWWRHPNQYRPLRTALVLTNVIGFAVYWLYPMAPPRLLRGGHFVDVVASTHPFGSWHSGALATQANQLAAMPSLHIAWAVWCSYAVWRVLRAKAAGARRQAHLNLVWLYPAVTSVAVMATGNHFLVDIVAGVATLALATAIAERAHVWRAAREVIRELASGQS